MRISAPLMLFATMSLVSYADPVDIDPEDALQHVNKAVRVRMEVKNVGRAKDQISLNSKSSFKDDGCFIVRLTIECQAALAKAGVRKPAGHFSRKTIEVTGTVGTIKPGGFVRPVIYVKSVDQIRILDPGNSKPKPATITADEAAKHIGKQVRLRMTVAAAGGSPKFVSLHSKQPSSQPGNVQIRIGIGVQAAFKAKGVENAGKAFGRREIEVTGVIMKNTRGGFTIDISDPDDIQLVLKSQRVAPKITELVNREVELFLRDDRQFAGVTVLDVKYGDVSESISSLTVSTDFSKNKTYTAEQIKDVYVDGVPLDLSFNTDKNALLVDSQKRQIRLETAAMLERRLIAKRRKLWPRLTDEENQDWVSTHHEFVDSVKSRYPQLHLRTLENDFYIMVSDLDPGSMRKYMSYLDKLYRRMCFAYGVPVGRNVWCGKCVIAAFKNQTDYMRFESEVMENPRDDLHASGGVCHSGPTGRVIIAVWKGQKNDEGTFSHKLVHETSHGFVWRYISNCKIPSWLNEGMADWIAFYIVKSPGKVNARHARAAKAAQQSGTLGGIFSMPRISREYYGAGSVVVDILLKIDSEKFRQFFDGIKTGLDAEVALKEAYGFDYQELARLYGRRIGRDGLKP